MTQQRQRQTETGRPRYREALSMLRVAQKPGAGVPAYMRWVNRSAARVIAAAAASRGWTPNAVTLVSALLAAGGIGVLAFVPPSWTSALAAAVLLNASFACDSADGQLARLTGRSGPAGEWLDHVLDAVRAPAVHLATGVGLALHLPEFGWAIPVAVLFALLSVGQFTSQILAEQLAWGGPEARRDDDGRRQSWILLPTDTGVLNWGFLLWALPAVFCVWYVCLFAVNSVHAAVSMRRKYVKLMGTRAG